MGRALQLYHRRDRIESRPFEPVHPRDLPFLTAGIRYFKAKWRQDSGSKVCRDAGCRKWPSALRDWAKVSVGMTGSRNLCVHFEVQNIARYVIFSSAHLRFVGFLSHGPQWWLCHAMLGVVLDKRLPSTGVDVQVFEGLFEAVNESFLLNNLDEWCTTFCMKSTLLI